MGGELIIVFHYHDQLQAGGGGVAVKIGGENRISE